MDCRTGYNRLSFLTSQQVSYKSNTKTFVIVFVIIVLICCIMMAISSDKYNIVNALVTKSKCNKQIISSDNSVNDCSLDVQYNVNNNVINNKIDYQSQNDIKDGDKVALVYENNNVKNISQLPSDSDTLSVLLLCCFIIILILMIMTLVIKNKQNKYIKL
jgi:hypothetical protein